MKLKAKDVARDLGISTATVSLALNNKPGVNEQTRNKVLNYIKEFEEDSNDEWKNRKEKTIRMYTFLQESGLFDENENARHYMGYVEASKKVRAAGYKMDMVFVDRAKDDFVKILRECEEENVAGVLLGAAYMTREDYQFPHGFKIPFVVCDQNFEDMRTDSIELNNRQGVKTGLSYLYENGHRDILYLRNSKNFYNMYERRSACNSFMNENKLQQIENERILDIGSSSQEIYDNMHKYIKNKGHIPSAVFAENYEVTIGVSRALQSFGYRIPEDVSIVGFDEIPGAAILGFQPAFLRALHGNVASIAVGRLLDRIKKRARESVQILVNTEFVIGNSVKKIK